MLEIDFAFGIDHAQECQASAKNVLLYLKTFDHPLFQILYLLALSQGHPKERISSFRFPDRKLPLRLSGSEPKRELGERCLLFVLGCFAATFRIFCWVLSETVHAGVGVRSLRYLDLPFFTFLFFLSRLPASSALNRATVFGSQGCSSRPAGCSGCNSIIAGTRRLEKCTTQAEQNKILAGLDDKGLTEFMNW